MSGLRFEGTPEERRAQMEMALISLDNTVHGNSLPGLEAKFYEVVSRLDNLIARLDTQERERDRYRKERAEADEKRYKHDKEQMTRLGILLTVCLVLLGAITAYITFQEAKQHSMFPIASNNSLQNAQAVVPYLERNLYVSH